MKRRTTSIAVVVGIAVVAVGLGARLKHPPETAAELCEDLDYVFEGCGRGVEKSECENTSEELAAACQAGCVRIYCPEKVPCTGADPMWCAPCSDMYGAAFHTLREEANDHCNYKYHFAGRKHDLAAAEACWKADMERLCPELAGTDWLAQYRAALKR